MSPQRITPECFAILGAAKRQFLPSKGRRGRELRDTGWTSSLGVDNLILMTKLGEDIDGNKEESVMHDREGGSFIRGEMGK